MQQDLWRFVAVAAVMSLALCSTAVSFSVNSHSYYGRHALFFPGQGAQHVGMAVESAERVPAAKELFDIASEILNYDLLELCRSGPKSELDRTDRCQPAIFVASMAALERLKTEKGQGELDKTTCCLGLSLGEYSALCFAGAISFKDGVMLTSIRGTAMQIAADAVASGMVSVVGLDKEAVIQLCDVASSNTGGNSIQKLSFFLLFTRFVRRTR
eukprot:TRINITY_DN87926_c0_g1_i1.p1 TRINITY_DN87926_c0_g1~~TRINITY_DN87926_c0_g1_i1.p1  ORF type:complete len:214 (+),score=14.24 TRINITY_DN87926_c0_g1_i1:94-735(+)